MTPDLAEFVGCFMGDGSLHSRSIRLCVANTDPDVVTRLTELGQSLFGLQARISSRQGYTEVCFNSIRLVLWWEACGFSKKLPNLEHQGKGYTPHIPDALLHTNDPAIYAAFIRGLFEADGTQTNQFVSFSTCSGAFCDEVQVSLLALGFITTKKVERAGAGRYGSKSSNLLRLLNVASTARFLEEIGFVSERKQLLQGEDHPQAARFDYIPVPRKLVDELAPTNDNLRKTLLMALSRHRRVLERLREIRGRPSVIQTDNGPEFTGHVLDAWTYKNRVKLLFIEPVKPVQNAHIESFNSKVRNECLDLEWFTSLREAREVIEHWRMQYNQFRPHSALGNVPPEVWQQNQAEKLYA